MDAAERAEVFTRWSTGLRELARRPNVFCKVGGLGMPFWGFGLENRDDPIGYAELAEIWRPYVETALEAFGPDRCMAESNYPVDGRSAGYVPLWNALKHITSGLSANGEGRPLPSHRGARAPHRPRDARARTRGRDAPFGRALKATCHLETKHATLF